MNSLSFPDINNVWLAIAAPEHVHASIARGWWEQETGVIAFCRLTQLGFLRLMTTAAGMDGRPLTMIEAWRVYDRLYASPKVWADAWLLAVTHSAEGVLVTFDKALASRGALCLLPKEEKPSRRQAPQRSS
jgi:predicted nucleic acid-binding protein